LRNKLPSFKLRIKEELLSMDDFVLVQVDKGVHYLLEIVLYLNFSEPLPSLEKFVQSLIGAYL
jgi:hypothetical protein